MSKPWGSLMARVCRWILIGVICLASVSLPQVVFDGFSVTGRAWRELRRVEAAFVDYKDSHGLWPASIASLPDPAIVTTDVGRFEFDAQANHLHLTITKLDPHESLWRFIGRHSASSVGTMLDVRYR